jgi:sugar (pentulose or hexulose) kinase
LDSRSKDIVEKFYRDGLSEVIYDISGWRLIPSMQLAHLCWLKNHEPETLKIQKPS